MKILAHTCFIGNTGYANHARSFFTALNKYHEVKIRNCTVGELWSGLNNTPHDKEPYITDEMKQMLCLQTLNKGDGTKSDFPIYQHDDLKNIDVHIVLVDMNHYYFYDNYEGYKIAYNVWETTRYPDIFFQKLMEFDEIWVPSNWQKECLIEQGCASNKIKIVHEGVDIDVFKPIKYKKKNKFRFLLFGRWEYRKSTTEIIKTFGETFKGLEDEVELICSVENPYPFDGLKSTKERIELNGIDYKNVKFINFPKRDEYVKYLQEGDVFISCARSEGWNLPLEESMACGIPAIYSNWGAQLEYAKGKGIPISIIGTKPANIGPINFPGDYCEPDFNDLSEKLMDVFLNYDQYKTKAIIDSEQIREMFAWDQAAKKAANIINNINNDFVFVTTGNDGYMPVIEQMVKSLFEFSKSKILVYGVDCVVPFDYPNVIKRTINTPKYSEHDKWYWKQYTCIESLNENFENYVWIDGDVIVNYNIDNIKQYFNKITNYPISDIHIQEMYNGTNEYGEQWFNQHLCELFNVQLKQPLMHICLYVYNKECKWWFEEIIKEYKSIPLNEYKKYLLWNDEGLDNILRWKYNCMDHLPLSNFDTSSYDGDVWSNTNETMQHFYTFWNKEGPYNFNKIYGFQYFPKDKSNILYFHGNKNPENSNRMLEFIKLKRDDLFFKSEYFYTSIYDVKNLGEIKDISGGTYEIAQKYGWDYAIYHEIYNLQNYYNNNFKNINDGDIVVDLGGNIGIFNRWAYSQGAAKVISFEPDKRYFKLLSLNSDPKSILFNAAISDKMGEINIYESKHLGGSSLIEFSNYINKYKIRTYTLDYLFEINLIDHIDFLKIDIEGSEINALKGINNENLKKVKTIVMEYHHEQFNFNINLRNDLINRLKNNGFHSYLLFLGYDNKLQMIYFTK
jgi:FkbM family methyltransferase